VSEIPAEYREAAQARVQALIVKASAPTWFGAWTLFRKEILRFWGIARQTIISPIVTTMLYFVVFGYSLGDRLREIDGIPYIDFLVPGLVLLAMVTNAYINSAFSLFIAKVHGTLIDILVTPLSYLQLLSAFVAAAIVRAMLIGGIIWGVSMAMGANAIHNVPLTILFMLLVSTAFGLLGIVVAILSTDFDHINFLPSFLITPLTFLGGVFYSIEMLPQPWDTVSRLNPVLYMVNGLRYGMTGVSDVPWWHGIIVLTVMILVVGSLALHLLKTGKRLRE
jgi:ABC-2 type transport system permease protein